MTTPFFLNSEIGKTCAAGIHKGGRLPMNLRPITGQKSSEGKAPAFAGGLLLLELVDEIVLTPGDMRGQIHAELCGNLIARAELTKRSGPVSPATVSCTSLSRA